MDLRTDPRLPTPVYHQENTNSCTANAAAAAFWYEEKLSGNGKLWETAGPSRLFIYWNARENPGAGDNGSNMRDAMKGIDTFGACLEADWPFEESRTTKTPSDNAFQSAKDHTIRAYYRLDPDRPDKQDATLTPDQKDKLGDAILENLRSCLTEGFPVAFGFWYYLPPEEMFDEGKKPYVLKDIWNLPDTKFPRHTFPEELPKGDGAAVVGGHSVLATGYDDTRKLVLVQNSRGADWSDNGTFWMPYTWNTDFAAMNDFWTVRISLGTPADGPETKKGWEDVHNEILAST